MNLNFSLTPVTPEHGIARRHRRALFSVPVRFHHLAAGGVRTSHGISLDISESGLGALVQGSLQVGDTVALDLPLAERMLSAIAIVRHTSDLSSGFEFVGLTPEERLHITSVAGGA
ncbi:MAG TPA: PilZ domain-containing protein [Candidatus Sulfotelmatobacter sp.]|nr:PilZ domain-containing protein [Candidatus Sulfotelmatobacter sp.]